MSKTERDEGTEDFSEEQLNSLTEAQLIDLFKKIQEKLGNLNPVFQTGDNQINHQGGNQLVVDKNACREIVTEVIETLVKHLGQQATTEIVKEAIKSAVAKI